MPIGSKAHRDARAYLERARPQLVGLRDEGCVFVNMRGAGLSRQGLYKIVQQHARSAGLEHRMSPHTLRHTFATHLWRAAAICARCRRCSGTPTSRTTQIYTHLSADRLRDVYFDAHPARAPRRAGPAGRHVGDTDPRAQTPTRDVSESGRARLIRACSA